MVFTYVQAGNVLSKYWPFGFRKKIGDAYFVITMVVDVWRGYLGIFYCGPCRNCARAF